MLFKILGIGALSLGLATSVLAQQTGSGNAMQPNPNPSLGSTNSNTTSKNRAVTTTVDPGTTGSTANGDSGMPNANGNSQGCNGSATNAPNARNGEATGNAPGANCQ